MATERRLMLMIDGDNAQASLFPQMLAEVSKHGVIKIRRVYGDWASPQLNPWKELLNTYALKPEQQFSYTAGKNATDIALIIDAMDFINTAGVDGICIVSSDSDYTPLATRIREKNFWVMGIGRSTTPPAFINACDLFVRTEDLKSNTDNAIAPSVPTASITPIVGATKAGTNTTNTNKASANKPTATKASSITAITTKTSLVKTSQTKPIANKASENKAIGVTITDLMDKATLFRTAFNSVVQEDGWAHLSALGSGLRKVDSAFDPRKYGYKLLSQLVKAYPKYFQLETRKSKGGNPSVYIKLKGKLKGT